MFSMHTMNLWYPLYHYWKMGGSFKDLSPLQWITEGVPKKYIAPPDNIEVMNNIYDFHAFRQKMISYLYKEYVEESDSDDE